mmetsp:Transcript_4048/g.4698  ORF Transcript_4048/g.4698 Transcript_4048/m.4698 type:complete len:475 (+) Transcript_4048:329-1753(+)
MCDARHRIGEKCTACKKWCGRMQSSKVFNLCKWIFAGIFLLRISYLYGRNSENHEHWLHTKSRLQKSKNCSAVLSKEETKKIAKDRYTIVVSTYSRDNELIKNVDHWLSCPALHEVHVIWHNPNRDVPELLLNVEKENACATPRLKIRKQTQDMLSNRFRTPKDGFATEAVFNIDDDAVIDCRLMTSAFKEWKRLGDDSLVGFEPRQIDWIEASGQGYTWWSSCTQDECKYNTLWPTKGAFLHRKFYNLYWTKEYLEVRKLVDKYFTGEDILMTFIHFHHYYKKKQTNPPILCVQAVTDFTRHYLDKTDRFSPMEKIAHLPEVVFYKTGIAEATSLGARSSWYRNNVVSAIGKLANEIATPMLLPPMTEQWYFVKSDGVNGFLVDLPCATPELFDSLTCSTKVSLTVLNTTDAELFCLAIVFLLVGFCYGCYKLLQHRAKVMHFEEIRARKISVASPVEAEIHTTTELDPLNPV